jgi:hypothetical protein
VRHPAFWLVLTLSLQSLVGAWGNEGHRIVGAVASQGLNSRARTHVTALIGSSDLSTVATWADDLRALQRHERLNANQAYIAHDADALAFKTHDPQIKQAQWHFTDTPVGATAWSAPAAGTDDAVTMIRRCEKVLAHHAPAGEFLTERQAIRFLIHYVGDIHQPLHAVNGFWDYRPSVPTLLPLQDALATIAEGFLNDQGGNKLYYGSATYHHLWDSVLPRLAAGFPEGGSRVIPTTPGSPFISELVGRNGAAPWKLPSHDDPKNWAKQSLDAANAVYTPIGAAALVKSQHRDRHGNPFDAIDFPEGFISHDYKQAQLETVRVQLAAAGRRLAGILNRVWPSSHH